MNDTSNLPTFRRAARKQRPVRDPATLAFTAWWHKEGYMAARTEAEAAPGYAEMTWEQQTVLFRKATARLARAKGFKYAGHPGD